MPNGKSNLIDVVTIREEKKKKRRKHKVYHEWVEKTETKKRLKRTREEEREVEKQEKYPEGVSVGGQNRIMWTEHHSKKTAGNERVTPPKS